MFGLLTHPLYISKGLGFYLVSFKRQVSQMTSCTLLNSKLCQEFNGPGNFSEKSTHIESRSDKKNHQREGFDVLYSG